MSWLEQSENASFQSSNWHLKVPMLDLANGARVSSAASESTGFRVFGVTTTPEFHPKLVDHYTRGGDLVMRYDQQEGKPFSLQLDYRVVDYSDDPHDLVMELWVSVETTLLSSYPTVHVLFDVGGSEAHFWRLENRQAVEGFGLTGPNQVDVPLVDTLGEDGKGRAAAFTRSSRLHGSDCHFAVLVHPLDLMECRWRVRQGAGPGLCLDLFDRFMEKGVIRRARVLYGLSKTAWGHDRLEKFFQRFSASPLPLTT